MSRTPTSEYQVLEYNGTILLLKCWLESERSVIEFGFCSPQSYGVDAGNTHVDHD